MPNKNESSFFTNTDRSIFGLTLPQEVAAALFARYSRSTKSLRDVFTDEFLGNSGSFEDANEKAGRFHDRVLSAYGDDSVAQLGGAQIACENISGLAALFLTDFRIGVAFLEKSTRYVRFDKKDQNGNYPYYVPDVLANVPEYREVMDLLFDTYSCHINPTIEWLKNNYPLEKIAIRNPETGEERLGNEWEGEWVKNAYSSALRSRALDILRPLLPIATLTNIGISANGQEWENILTSGYSSTLHEVGELTNNLRRELDLLIPSFVRRSGPSVYRTAKDLDLREFLTKFNSSSLIPDKPVELVGYDRRNELNVIDGILFRYGLSVHNISPHYDYEILEKYIGARSNRRDKPGRALENATYTFRFCANLGIYRDLKRHRVVTQERELISARYGYDTPQELIEMETHYVFHRVMFQAKRLYDKILSRYGEDVAQYAVPLAYRQRWYMKVNLRELLHICELRTTPQGHPDYRRIAQTMWKEVVSVNDLFAKIPNFVDFNEYEFGRLTSEIKQEKKKESFQSDDRN